MEGCLFLSCTITFVCNDMQLVNDRRRPKWLETDWKMTQKLICHSTRLVMSSTRCQSRAARQQERWIAVLATTITMRLWVHCVTPKHQKQGSQLVTGCSFEDHIVTEFINHLHLKHKRRSRLDCGYIALRQSRQKYQKQGSQLIGDWLFIWRSRSHWIKIKIIYRLWVHCVTSIASKISKTRFTINWWLVVHLKISWSLNSSIINI